MSMNWVIESTRRVQRPVTAGVEAPQPPRCIIPLGDRSAGKKAVPLSRTLFLYIVLYFLADGLIASPLSQSLEDLSLSIHGPKVRG